MPTTTKRTPSEVLADKRSHDVQRREEGNLSVRADSIDEKRLTCEMAYASEEPVERWFGNEVLECTKEACDFSRLNNGAPLLLQHDARLQIGVIERAWVDADRKCRAVVRFANDDEGRKYFGRVKDGIMRKVSVGYRINDLILKEQSEGELETYIAKRWTGHEISLVSIPADDSVGVDRSAETVSKPTAQPIRKMDTITETTPEKKTEVSVNERQQIQTAERSRVAEITAMAAKFNVPAERSGKAINDGETAADFGQWVMRHHLKADPIQTKPEIGMDKKDKRRYSLVNAINRIANRQSLDGTLEGDASKAAAKHYKREDPAAGFIMPHDVANFADREMIQAMLRVSPSLAWSGYGKALMGMLGGGGERQLLANNFTGAGALIAEDFLGGSFIELLRNRALLTSLGVGTLSGLQGNVAIPRQSGPSTAYWLNEADAVTASQQSFAQVLATPKRLAVQTAYNKQLLAQSTLDVEALVRDDHVRVIALAKDLAGIQGTGGVQPRGILNGPTTDTTGGGNNITALTWGIQATRTNQLAFMAAIQTANADIGTMQWLTNPTVRAKWQSIPQVPNYPVYLTNDEGMSIGYPTPITNQISTTGAYANRTILGVWGQAMFCDWAGYDVVVDPYTRAGNNEVVVTVNLMTDFIVRHWPSFAISTDSGAQ